MMTKISISLLGICYLICLTISQAFGQSNHAVVCGSIEYERKIMLKKKIQTSLEGEEPSFWMEEYLNRAPTELKDNFKLKFNETESLYTYLKPLEEDSKFWSDNNDVADKNTVYKNYHTKERISQKQLFEEDFLLTDSIKHFNWKMTDELRDVAGYTCRKATTIIHDSLYVIAFYTDDIICPSGPEGFSGLPGTILGLVMPRLYVTWFATKVTPFCGDDLNINKPVKGKKTTEKDLMEKLSDRFSRYKKWYESLVWNLVI